MVMLITRMDTIKLEEVYNTHPEVIYCCSISY